MVVLRLLGLVGRIFFFDDRNWWNTYIIAMEKVLLIEVEDHFLIENRGLVLVPPLKMPDDFKNFESDVKILRPDGSVVAASARFDCEHLLYSAKRGEGAYVVPIAFRTLTKTDVPVGSKIFDNGNVTKRFGGLVEVERRKSI